MTTALSPSPEPVTESSDLATTIASAQRSSWYDPDASAWEPQPPELFEALRTSNAPGWDESEPQPATERVTHHPGR